MTVVVDGVGAQAIRVGLTIVDGGLITSAVVFLLYEPVSVDQPVS
jgi:hypothetical protein